MNNVQQRLLQSQPLFFISSSLGTYSLYFYYILLVFVPNFTCTYYLYSTLLYFIIIYLYILFETWCKYLLNILASQMNFCIRSISLCC